jgi:TorA maturation chaperone TorD
MEPGKAEAWRPILVGEILVFRLLGKTLYVDLEPSWLEALIQEEVFSEAPFGEDQAETQIGIETLQRWTRENRDGLDEQELKALLDDQMRLFIGLGKVLAPVWESVYFSEKRLVFQEQTLAVREWYRRYGLEAQNSRQEPDDHIGLELIFAAHLANLALEALEKHEEPAFDSMLQAQRDFLNEHLLRWGPAWCRLVKRHAQTDFYRGLAHLTHGALLACAEALQMGMPKEVSL